MVRGGVEPPTFRFSGLRNTVHGGTPRSVLPAHLSRMAFRGLSCTNVYETRNETALVALQTRIRQA